MEMGISMILIVLKRQNVFRVYKFIENTKRQSLSTSALETLSIIAYNPKITKSEIENIRGVNSDFAVNRLQECGLIEEVARLNLPGRPAAYSVTTDFLKAPKTLFLKYFSQMFSQAEPYGMKAAVDLNSYIKENNYFTVTAINWGNRRYGDFDNWLCNTD